MRNREMKNFIGILSLASLIAMSLAVNAETELKPAIKPGLFDAPVPKGAVLIKSVPQKGGKDAEQTYSIKATSKQIMDFYEKYMPLKGWEIFSKPNKPNWLVYQKGIAIIVISIDEKKGAFLLKGHKTST
jgi:hypothetical protein